MTATAARLANIPFRLLGRKAFVPPKKALILQTCCLSQVMLATPLLAVLDETYPQARFDWAISDWARPAVAGNPRVTELVAAGPGGLKSQSWRELWTFIRRLRATAYDTCFIPSRSSLLAFVAWQAGIPQRIGINWQGRGFAHTVAVSPPPGATHVAEIYLAMAAAAGADVPPGTRRDMEFYPRDTARTAVTRRLVDELDWLGDRPLVLLHPGGGANPLAADARKRWPVARFALLGNHLAHNHRAQVVILGAKAERERAQAVVGMMAAPAVNWAGETTLGELGALCEMADLYVGSDSGPTHVAAAQACPTLAIFGPSLPAVSAPYSGRAPVVALRAELGGRTFSWERGVSVDEAAAAAERLLAQGRGATAETAVADGPQAPEN